MLPDLAGAAGGVAALGFVLLLILLAARGARLLPAVKAAAQGSASIRLRGTLALDARRRLYLVEADGLQALVLTGGAQDVLLPWRPASAPPLPGAP